MRVQNVAGGDNSFIPSLTSSPVTPHANLQAYRVDSVTKQGTQWQDVTSWSSSQHHSLDLCVYFSK